MANAPISSYIAALSDLEYHRTVDGDYLIDDEMYETSGLGIVKLVTATRHPASPIHDYVKIQLPDGKLLSAAMYKGGAVGEGWSIIRLSNVPKKLRLSSALKHLNKIEIELRKA